MHFQLEQRIVGSPSAVAAAFADPGYYASLAGMAKVEPPDVLDHRVDGDVVTMHIRYRFAGDLSSAARAVLDPNKLTWVEESIHDLAARTVKTKLFPDNYADRFRCEGSWRFEPSGADGTLRICEGDLTVRTPFVGRIVEQAIVSGLREHFDDEVVHVERWIAEHATD